ncbi:uncharacterized protein [Oryctolagus cuniculus]|uniref:uncharacterized protein n=1 Tax=Oryctolagus cuniculus TaxID=9986 RepID=UPI00387A549F
MSLLQHRTQPRILLGSGPPLPSLVPRGMFVPVLCWGSFFMAGPHPRQSCGTQSQALCGPTILLTPASCRPWAAIPLATFLAFQVGRNHPASQDLHFCGPSSARHFHGYETGHRVDAEVQLLGSLPFVEPAHLPCKTRLGLHPGQEQLVRSQRLSHEEAEKRCLPPLLPPRGSGCETNPEWMLKLSCQVISHSQRDCTASCSTPAGSSSWRGATDIFMDMKLDTKLTQKFSCWVVFHLWILLGFLVKPSWAFTLDRSNWFLTWSTPEINTVLAWSQDSCRPCF